MSRTRGRQRFVRAAALIVVVLAISSCTDKTADDPPLSSAGLVTSPSAGPSKTERPRPEVPAAAKANTPAGAEAFARYVLSLYGYVYQTGDTWPLSSIAGPKCSFCQSTVDEVHQMHGEGHRQTGGDLTVTLLSVAPDLPEGAAAFTVVVKQAPTRELDQDGREVDSNSDLPDESLVVALRWESAGWTVFNIGTGDTTE